MSGGQLAVSAPAVACEMVRDINAKPGSGVKVEGSKGVFNLGGAFSANDGRELAYVRAQDANGAWGPLKALWLTGRARSMPVLAVRAAQAKAARKTA